MTKPTKRPTMAAFNTPSAAPPPPAAPAPKPAASDTARVNFPFRVTEAQRTALKRFALENGSSVQDLLEEAVNAFFAGRSQPEPFKRD